MSKAAAAVKDRPAREKSPIAVWFSQFYLIKMQKKFIIIL